MATTRSRLNRRRLSFTAPRTTRASAPPLLPLGALLLALATAMSDEVLQVVDPIVLQLDDPVQRFAAGNLLGTGQSFVGGSGRLAVGTGELGERMGIEILEVGPDRMVGRMPVEGNRQPFGLLHGGANVVLAETLGSVAAALHARINSAINLLTGRSEP